MVPYNLIFYEDILTSICDNPNERKEHWTDTLERVKTNATNGLQTWDNRAMGVRRLS